MRLHSLSTLVSLLLMPTLQNIEQSFGVVPIYRKGNDLKFLLIQHLAGHWAFPKGHAEPGETEIQTARRELREETSINDVMLITSPIFEEHYRVNRKGEAHEKLVRYWVGYVRDLRIRVQESEVKAHKWASLAEARQLITYAQSRNLFDEVIKYLAL